MAANFHEQFDRPELPLPSDRSTGLVFAFIACVVAYFFQANTVVLTIALVVAAILVLISLLVPRILRPLNIMWMRFALLLSKIVNPVVMMVLFGLVIVPAGLIMRLRYDPLLKRRDVKQSTYWIDRTGDRKSSMVNQF